MSTYVDAETGEIIEDAEVVNESGPGVALAVRPPAAAVEYRPRFALSLPEMTEQVKALDQFKHTVMRDGVDYGTIPGTNKPSLLKPGAERLLQVFGLGHRMLRIGWDTKDDGWWGATYICEVTKLMPDGSSYVVSSCEAYASYDESRYWNRPRNGGAATKAPWNTVIKMAQKRALVGAALTATGTSEFFTQDVEDYDRETPAPTNRGTSREGRAAPAQGVNRTDVGSDGSSASSGSGLTDKQEAKIRALYRSVGEGLSCLGSRQEQLALASNIVGRPIDSHRDLTKAEASRYIDLLVKLESGDAAPQVGPDGSLVGITYVQASPEAAAPGYDESPF